MAKAAKPSKATQALEKQLERYRSMRDFKVTAEPRGNRIPRSASNRKAALPFVVQKHAATRLHYDFRLAWSGVLKSWAVAKGPSFFPGDKRLAVQVEDHPIEYGSFEGTIPKGQYGGGAVMLWDYGEWEPHGDVDRGLADGHLKFALHGTKLKGDWVLVRMRNRDNNRSDKPNWLLIKEHDEFARAENDSPITETEPDSAISERTIEGIAKMSDRVWQSNHAETREPTPANANSTPARPPKQKPVASPSLKAAPSESFPGFISPQLARASTTPPDSADWIHELKLDGYRIQIQIRSGKKSASDGKKSPSHRSVALLTRKGLDWTHRMPAIAEAAQRLPVESAILDGEVVVLNDAGATSFADLQAAFQAGARVPLTYFAFDLLHLDGHNLRGLSLLERRKILARLFANLDDDSPLHLSEHFAASGKMVFAKACALGAEGIVAKLASAPYTSGRSNTWLKSKCIQEQEFVIGGFTGPSKGGPGIGALLVGYYESGKLRYAGRSGTGFTQKSQLSLRKQLDKLQHCRPPFEDMPRGISRGVHWVKPQLVAQIAFSNWTRDNLLRQAAFKGLREDKPAKEVMREVAISPSAALSKKKKGAISQPAAEPSASAQPPAAAYQRVRPRPQLRARTAPTKDLPITHPDKVLDPESGMTKLDLANYYIAIASHMLPQIADRPLSIVRCPEGSGKPCFFQKHVGMGLPKDVESVPVVNRKTGKKEEYLTVSTPEGLVGLAQMGVLEIHPWGSRNPSLDKPDRIIFDLDPDAAVTWKTLADTAKLFRARLNDLGLESFLKTTGGKGLHVVIPIKPDREWPEIKQFAHKVVLTLEKQNPTLYLTRMTKALRKNRIYLDYLRNDRESTAVAPWSPRARPGAPVAMPLDWKELNAKTMPRFTVIDFADWRKRLQKDPWAAMNSIRQNLSRKALTAVRD